MPIEERNSDSTLNLALDTILLKKQCIVFVNTKRSAESVAEKIAKAISKDKKYNYSQNIDLKNLKEISKSILEVLQSPTAQCRKLSETIECGIAFHHSGLISEQRKIVEDNFKSGKIKIIVATPTLAIGMDLPAFRVIIRDLKRYGLWGMDYIPVLEYEQQCGRAGRPSYDTHGEAICIAEDASQKQEITDTYLNGVPEPIISKLAVEPIMRTYILSLIASGFIHSSNELEDFFKSTFYAKHYGDLDKLSQIIDRMTFQLSEWKFINIDEQNVEKQELKNDEKEKAPSSSPNFVSALRKLHDKKILKNNNSNEINNNKLSATNIGHRVSELYLDPYTANNIICALNIAMRKEGEELFNEYSFMHLVCTCLEIRPLLRVKSKEMDSYIEILAEKTPIIITEVPEMFDSDYEEFLNSVKTCEFFMEWLNEQDEEYLFEKYDVRPGELHAKKERADWIIYCIEEICRLNKMHSLIKVASKLRFRLKYGAKEELIPLLQLKNIGRVRARKLFNSKIKDIADLKSVDLTTLSQLVGKSVALDLKKQVGQELSDDKIIVPENKRKGQKNLFDY
jgi:helicase